MIVVAPQVAGYSWQRARAERERMPDAGPIDLASLVLRRFGVTQPPVPVEAIARALGAVIHKRPLGALEGALDSREDPPAIWVNSTHSSVKQRFTMAHELGHLIMHERAQLFRDRSFSSPSNTTEAAANDFAAHLLMPLWMLEPIVIGSRRTTEALAALFDVSKPAMQWQLSKLL